VHAALQSVGCDVIDVGMVPTPTVQLAVEHHHAAGGLAITASHNPIEWNALKFIGPSGLFLDGAEGTEMRQVVEGKIPRATWDKLGTIEQDKDAAREHIEKILALPFLDVDRIRKREFRVALDCVRGAGGRFMPVLLELLGCRLATINMEPDGRFPRPPEPVAENLGELQKLVQDEDPKHPLTDQAIVNILRESGVQIARRTVAKYRDQLGVLSARMRKRV